MFHRQKISIKLSGIEGRGGAGLHPDKRYYIYDFWNDKLIGTFGGNETLEQELRKGEARQMAVREVESNPFQRTKDTLLLTIWPKRKRVLRYCVKARNTQLKA